MTSLLCFNQVAALVGTLLGIIIALESGVVVWQVVSLRKMRRAKSASAASSSVAKPSRRETTVHSAIYLAHVAFFSALGVALLYLEFPLLPATPWLEMNFSDVPTLLASFMYGPITGAAVNIVKILVKLLISGTSTNLVGPLSNLISGTVYAVVAGVIYKIRRNKKGAVLSLLVSSLVFCGAMWLCNQFILLPVYGMTEHSVMMPALWWTLLFNVIKTAATCVITFLLYKPLSRALHWTMDASRRSKRSAKTEPAPADAEQTEASQDKPADSEQ